MKSNICLLIDGTPVSATFTEIPNRRHNMFELAFENGYYNIFFSDVETGIWIEEDLGATKLAADFGKLIKDQLRSSIHVPKLLTWHNQAIEKKLISFGFYSFMKDKYKMYEIYNINKRYMYTLVEMENEDWQILGNNVVVLKNIDPVFIQHVIQILPMYRINVQ